jgi:ABC-2 type transport system ATP-binding protein
MIAFESVTKRFGSFTAVDGVTCTIEKGEYFALLGPNGAGKTTLVRMLLGLSRPTGGAIRIRGIDSTQALARQGVGYLPEKHQIPPHLTGWRYLLRHAALCGLHGDEAKRTCEALLEAVGMAGRDRQKARTYSKGMSQRVGLAAAMMGRPDLLVLDEPITGLDPLGIREVRGILERLRGEGVTVFINSHLLSEVARICDTAAIINKGRIIVKDALGAITREGETLEDVFVRTVRGDHA